MPYCPKCRAEYREGFKKCTDCNVELVDELTVEDETPKSEMPNGIELEKLVRVNNEIEMSYISSMLDEEGIFYKVAGGKSGNFLEMKRGHISPKTDIYVDKSKMNEAMAIVLSIAGGIEEDE